MNAPISPALPRTSIAGLVFALVAAAACGTTDEGGTPSPRAGWPATLTFAMGVNPENGDALMRVAPFIQRIEKATGLPVTYFRGTSYSSVVEAMRARRIDGMETGVFSYLLAEKVAGAEAIAVYVTSRVDPAVYDPLLRPEYNGIIITRKGNGLRTIQDLRGRMLVLGDPAGTSDHLVPKNELIKAGLVPDKDVKTTFAGTHAAAILAVWHGKADAAATADTALHRYAESTKVEYCGFRDDEFGRAHSEAQLRALFEACPDGQIVAIHSAPIPGTPFALRGDLPADLKAVIRQAVLSTPRDPEFIRAAKKWYVDPSVELKLPDVFAYYDGMRQMATLLDLDLSRLK
jgi:phosphonate transport system substrate-binding protein